MFVKLIEAGIGGAARLLGVGRALVMFSLVILSTARADSGQEEISLETLVTEVKLALLLAQQKVSETAIPPLRDIQLEVNAIQQSKAGGNVSFFVFTLGKESSEAVTHTIRLLLTPPPSDARSNVSELSIAESLANSIVAGAEAIEAAGKGSPPLLAKELFVRLKFALGKDGDGSLTISFPPFELEGGRKVSNEVIQTISVRFSQ